MDKKAWFLKLLGVIFIFIIFILSSLGIYFYYFHVFKTLRVCVSPIANETNISCASNQDCIEIFLNNMTEIKGKIESMPQEFKEFAMNVFDSSVYCQDTCKIREFYGAGFGNIDEISSCKKNEKEILLKIRGKEGLQFLKYMRETKGS